MFDSDLSNASQQSVENPYHPPKCNGNTATAPMKGYSWLLIGKILLVIIVSLGLVSSAAIWAFNTYFTRAA